MKHINNLNKLSQYLLNVFLVFLCIFLLFFAYSLVTGSGPKTKDLEVTYEEPTKNYRSTGSPNVVSEGLGEATKQLGKNLKSSGEQLSATTSYISDTASNAATTVVKQTANVATIIIKTTANSMLFVVKQTANIIFIIFKTTAFAIKSVATFIISVNLKAFGFVFGTPVRAVASVVDKPIVSKIVTPSQQIAEVPIIDPKSPEIEKAILNLAEETENTPEVNAASTSAPRVRWPVVGEITTQFGVPHWPYQPVHTGLDISDHTVPGVTPVFPFRAGTVILAEYGSGLGNHIIIDHGNGITSVYGHLDSIDVSVGQPVNIDTELGRQGTTGVSTGTHLHLEIRINGQATDPIPFLNS